MPYNHTNYPISVYLTSDDRSYLEKLAKQLNVSRHSLLQFSVKNFIAKHKSGEVEIPVQQPDGLEIAMPT